MGRRHRRRGVAALIIGVALLAQPAVAATVPASEWAPKFCAALTSWDQALINDRQALQDALTDESITFEGAKAELISFLDHLAVDADQVVTQLQDAGVPKLPNGAKFMALFVTNLRSVGKEYAAAKVEAANIATGDFIEFRKTAVEVFTRFKDSDVALAKTVAILRKLDRRGKLVGALRRVESCGLFTDR